MIQLFEVTDNLIWHEYCLAFSYSRRIRAYIDRRRKINRWSNWFIIFVSASSSIFYWINTTLGAVGASCVALLLIVKELMPVFNQPDSELTELHKAATFYAEYFTKMEMLLVNLRYNNLHPAFCQQEFFELKGKAAKYLAITNEYFRNLPKIIEDNINKEFDNYVRELYTQGE